MPLNESLLIQLYQQSLGDLTHLIAFSNLDRRSFQCEIGIKTEYLISQEIVSFAIHIRRMVEALKCHSLTNQRSTHLLNFVENEGSINVLRSGQSINFSKLIGLLIHSVDIKVLTDSQQLLLFAKNPIKYLANDVRMGSKALKPLILISNADPKFVLVELSDFVKSADELLSDIVEECANAGVHVEHLIRDP